MNHKRILAKNHGKKWTEFEDDFISKKHKEKSDEEIAKILGRSKRAVATRRLNLWRHKAERLRRKARASTIDQTGVKEAKEKDLPENNGKKWTEAEVKFIEDNYISVSIKEISKELKRTEGAVRHKISKIKSESNKNKRWTKEEEHFIWANFETMSDKQIARKLKRSEQAVRQRRLVVLGINREEDDLQGPCWSHPNNLYEYFYGKKYGE